MRFQPMVPKQLGNARSIRAGAALWIMAGFHFTQSNSWSLKASPDSLGGGFRRGNSYFTRSLEVSH